MTSGSTVSTTAMLLLFGGSLVSIWVSLKPESRLSASLPALTRLRTT